MKWGIAVDNKSIDNLSRRLDRLEAAADEPDNFSDTEKVYRYGLTEQEYESMNSEQKHELRFNWYVSHIMPYYQAEVMSVYGLTSEEYARRTLAGDTSIYLPQPQKKFQSTLYIHRVAAVLGLDYHGLQDKIASGEIPNRIATGGSGFRDEDPNAVF